MTIKTTESESNYSQLEQKSILEILENINKEDITVPIAVAKVIPHIERFIAALEPKMKNGGRLFYIGAGTSGRLGILDASECPPTFGVEHGKVIGLIAGGDTAIRKAVEFAEDDMEQGWKDLSSYSINEQDCLVGIAASGTTPYVLGAIKACNDRNILTAAITCNYGSPLAKLAKHPIEVVVGPEFLTGSTRMKAGTAQKLVLNMISTSVMIRLGRVKGNKMVDMQLSNSKLISRGVKMIMDELKIEAQLASDLLDKHGNVRTAIDSYKK